MDFQTCVDCNWYDDVSAEDTFLLPFGDDMWICHLDAEKRGIEA